jgi:hypothetical protein
LGDSCAAVQQTVPHLYRGRALLNRNALFLNEDGFSRSPAAAWDAPDVLLSGKACLREKGVKRRGNTRTVRVIRRRCGTKDRE